tara:strand:- start:129 stop:689 length:561 start_codon:yes stop_codon:yes gene_type:complete
MFILSDTALLHAVFLERDVRREDRKERRLTSVGKLGSGSRSRPIPYPPSAPSNPSLLPHTFYFFESRIGRHTYRHDPALPLALARRIPEVDRLLRRGETVVRSQMLGVSMYKKTVDVIGMGNIGREVARKWIGACSSIILAHDPVAPSDIWSSGSGIEHVRVDSLDETVQSMFSLFTPPCWRVRGG